MDIAIIGAGPIGSYAGYLLAKSGHNISMYENHAFIGSPIQCTGILTSDFDEFNIPMDSFLVNTIEDIEVFSPGGKKINIRQKDYIVCRTKFDSYFAQRAKEAGAKIFLSHTFIKKVGTDIVIFDSISKKEKVLSPDIVIAADGPLSPTVKAYGFYRKRDNFFGVQATVEGNFESRKIKTYFGNDICPGLFAWVVPESSTIARVGLATKEKSKLYFDKFLKENGFIGNGFKVKEMQAGIIPVYNPNQLLYFDNCFVVGDASTYVKATTLGGIVPAMKQVEVLTDCILNGKIYTKEIAPVRRKMKLHLKLHKMFTKFSDKDWNKLVSYVGKSKISNILEKHTRDNPFPIVTKALLKEPKLLYFLKHLK
jgi:digeranylgeranylglycerophospholipid reductase